MSERKPGEFRKDDTVTIKEDFFHPRFIRRIFDYNGPFTITAIKERRVILDGQRNFGFTVDSLIMHTQKD